MSADLGDEKSGKKNSPSTSFITNSQPSTSSDFRLDLFGRHIPKILSKQLMGKLFDQFINQTGEHDSDQVGAFSCIPSIARFDAALLFVDISGFTVLSQKLPVDELRVSINSYFKIIIDTVMRYNGDVIKFAGDALFIVFQADSDDSPSKGSNQSDRMRQAITTAINCGVEINRLCTNYRIDLNKKKEKTQLNDSLTSLILSHDAPPSLLDPMSPFTSQSSDMDHTFLNVHSGCAAGTLGGIDVGAMDRWEYLIIGQPLQDISEAESVAEKGELVLTEYAHDLYCLGALNPDKTYNIVTEDGPPAERVAAEPAEDVIMPCGCRRTYNNCYRLKEKVRSHVEAPQVEEELEEEDYELQYYRDVVNCASVAFENGKHIVMRKFYEYLSQEVETIDLSNKLKTDLENTTTTSTSKKSPDVLMSTSLPVLPSAAPLSNSFNHLSSKTNSMQISDVNFVHDFYLKWIINCLTADFGRHVHEADRGPYEVAKIHRINCIEQCAKAYQDALTSGVNLNSQNTYVDNERDSSESFVRRIRNIVNNAHKSPHPQHHRPSLENIHHTRQNSHNNYLREQNQKKHEKLLKNDHELTGELRNVIMMFISIRSLSSSTPRPSILKKTLYFRPNDDYDEVDGCALDAFHFKRRSKVEKDSDKKLRNHYQTCMSLIVSSLKEQGGQLRQFIVDDKGTVAIGSFGLRGSATYDNAASAVEAALSIIGHLQNVGLNASIGITSGRAYCGAVGSLRRHEYAVMGPSVNLSARLMGKGKPGEIICDASTRSVDRLHSYRPIGEIKAKGYENPVAIFKPVFLRGSATNMSNIPRLLSADYGLGVNEAGVPITPGLSSNRDKITSREGGRTKRLQSKRLIGRDQEELQALEAILQNVLQLDEQHDHHHALHQICKDIQANLLETPYGLSVDTSLNTSCYSRIVVVNGTSGMGKSALITSLCDKLTEYSKISTWNLEILHGKSSNLTTSDPFKPWRTIIRAILGQFARYENIVKERREAEIDVPDSSLLAKKWKKGLDYVSSYLSEEEKALLPLLTAAHILPGLPETDVTKKLNGQEKLEYVIKVLQAILKYYPQLTNNVLLIVLDDSHSMDAHSWKLVHEVLLKNSGIIFLAGYYDEDDDSQSLSSASSSTISSSSLSRNQRHNRDHHGSILRHQSCRQIRLGGLDTTSIKLMMNNILEGYVDLSFMDPAVAEALQEMSGGNPLYIYEICLASLEKIRAKSAPLDLSSPNSIDSITMERYILDFRTNRIDEVIYYRFDRLDAQSQLILKMGAIITASNSHRGFNLEMLMHLLHHDEKGFASPDVLDGFFSCLTIDPSSPARNVKKGGRRRASTFMKDPAYLQAALQLYNKIQEMVASSTFIKVVHTHRRTSFQSNEELLEAQDHFPGAITPPPHGLLLSQPPSFIDLNHQNTRESDETGLTRTLSIMFTGFNEEQFCKDMVEICYDFNISLERKTIYDLMLDDQKESLHDRVATYLEKENEEAYQLHHITFSDLNEEAYHWEKATIWGNAMSGYYRAGMLLYGLGALREAHEYFGNSYRMLLMLRRDAKIKESSYTSIKLDELLAELEFINKEKEKESLRRQKSLEQRRRSKETNAIKEETERDEEENELEGEAGILISEEVIDSRLSAKNQLTHGDYALTKIDIYNTFGGDSNLLEIAVNLLLRLGQTALFLGEQVVITSAIFEDALRLMLLTWPRKHDHRDDQRDFTELPQSSSDDKGNPRIQMKRQRSNMRGSGGMSILDVKAKMDSFKLKDPSICFPIVSSISLLYRGRRLQDDEDNSKEWSLYSILLNLAKSSLLHYRVHYVQAIALMSSFSIERAKYDQAIAYLTEIKTWYNPSAYHPQLVHLYGEDRIPAAIANIAQMMLLQGYLPHAMVVLKELHLLGEKLEHQFSVGMLSNALSSIYLLCGNFSEAEKVFLLSRNGKRRSPRDRFVGNHEEVLGEMTDLMIDFFTLTKMVDQEEYNEVIKMIFTSKPLLPHSSPHHHSSTPLHDNHNGRHTPSPHSYLGSHHSTPHAAHHEERTVLGRLSKIVQRHYLNNANISVVWDAAANFGLGVEYLCAQITVAVALAMFKTSYKSDEITAKDMLLLGSEYYDAAIAKVGSSHRLLAYYLLLMLSKIEVLVHLYLYPEELVEKKEEILSDLLSCLKDLGKKIDENGFTFMYLRLIKLLQELKADSFLSEGVLKEVFIGVIGEKGEMPKRVEEGGEGSFLTQMEEVVFTQLEGKICDYHLQQTKEFQELFQSSFSGVMLDQIHDGVSEAKGEEHQLILLLRQYTTNLFTK